MDAATGTSISAEEAVAKVAAIGARLIAIDGLPVAGKSTLADAILAVTGGQAIYLDDFVRPETEWRGKIGPAFPFGYIRYDAFFKAVTDLAGTGQCQYRRYAWETGQLSDTVRTVTLDRPVVVEGVSALHKQLSPLYDLRFWVESDAASMLDAALSRGVGDWAGEWRTLFAPSVALYLDSDPRSRADFVVRGRGYSGAR